MSHACPFVPHPRRLRFQLLIVLATAPVAVANGLDRDRDPVLVTGADLPGLVGSPPGEVVGFRWESGWTAVPVQIDERVELDWGQIYDTDPIGFAVLTYADPGTFTGADTNPLFDGDDELVLRARDAGAISPGAPEPSGTVPGSGIELTVTNPLNTESAYLYLFRSDGSLDPAAGLPDIGYDFVLLSGDYLATYDVNSGPNPEDSRVTTGSYSVHFSDRWIRDETSITAGAATGVDILDRHKSQFAPGNCARTENTFSAGEGAFLANVRGPVRAIRSYCGANSGPTTYRVHRFYEEREDITTHLRVHAISGIVDYFDYSPAASGMTFRNDLNTAGVPVDGSPDVVVPGEFSWQMVSGLPGTLSATILIVTDIPGFDYSSYYLDDTTPPVTQCTGDAFAYGSSGLWEQDPIPNTDPYVGPANVYAPTLAVAYGEPNLGIAFARARAAEALEPVVVGAGPYLPVSTGVSAAAFPADRIRITLRPHPIVIRGRVELSGVIPGPIEASIIDVRGRRVGRQLVPVSEGLAAFDLDAATIPAGVYFLVATDDRGTLAAKRFVVLH